MFQNIFGYLLSNNWRNLIIATISFSETRIKRITMFYDKRDILLFPLLTFSFLVVICLQIQSISTLFSSVVFEINIEVLS